MIPLAAMRDELRERREAREAREFGLLVGAVLAALGGWRLARHGVAALPVAGLVAGSGIVLLGLGAVAPHRLRRLRRGWMALAEGMGYISTRVLLTAVFVLVVAPIAVVRRLAGAGARRRAPADSYWEPYGARQRERAHYERMF